MVGDAAFPRRFAAFSRVLRSRAVRTVKLYSVILAGYSPVHPVADLTPKRIGMIAPEAVALRIINPMRFCLLVFRPAGVVL
ncbi:hypothetical protein ACNKHK_27600 [Shigella flexneri]